MQKYDRRLKTWSILVIALTLIQVMMQLAAWPRGPAGRDGLGKMIMVALTTSVLQTVAINEIYKKQYKTGKRAAREAARAHAEK